MVRLLSKTIKFDLFIYLAFVGFFAACGNVNSQKTELEDEIASLTPSNLPVLNNSNISITLGVSDGITPTVISVMHLTSKNKPLPACTPAPALSSAVPSDAVTCTAVNSSAQASCNIYATISGVRVITYTACGAEYTTTINIPPPPAPLAMALSSGGPCGDCAGGSVGNSAVSGTSGPNTFRIQPTIGALAPSYPTGPATDQTTATVGCYASADGASPCNPGSAGGGSFQLLVGLRGMILDVIGNTSD